MNARGRYEVLILPPAERDLDAIHGWIAVDSPRVASRLSNSLLETAASLEAFPRRAPVTLARWAFGRQVRCLVHLNHRILFTIIGRSVFVLRITHASRRVPRRFSAE